MQSIDRFFLLLVLLYASASWGSGTGDLQASCSEIFDSAPALQSDQIASPRIDLNSITIAPLSATPEQAATLVSEAFGAWSKSGFDLPQSKTSASDVTQMLQRGFAFEARNLSGELVGVVFLSPGEWMVENQQLLVRSQGSDPEVYRTIDGVKVTTARGILIHKLAVRPDLNYSGVGRALLEHVRAFAVENDHSWLGLTTSSAIEPLLNWYLRWGFRSFGRIRDPDVYPLEIVFMGAALM